ncbi:MAG: sugar ABC transporter permease [Lachnospiraceae bacterium]|jgi:multiple sugar transport system permease protein|nr:sugar ABC transporter permease [Lachnospiraceae bacterium]MCI9135569.1 sugar ABC transporter permease [Lachnospiraceae bacterium]
MVPRRRRKKSENLAGYLMIAPNLIGFCVFTLFGIVFSLYMAFTDWNLLQGYENAHFVGLKNFKDMIGDVYLTASLRNNALLLLVVPVSLFLAAVLANLMNKAIYGKGGARALFFLPYVTNIVAVATVWQALFHKTKGPINVLLATLGIAEEALPGWLSSSKWALLGVAIVLLWKNIGYDILMYSGALQAIPSELYEAASLDGAGSVVKFFKITLPLLKPTTFMLTILGIISSLQMWSFVQIITNGGPGTATYTLGLYIYRSGFITYRTGYACALAWLLCVIVMVFTLIRWQTEKKFSAE